MGLFISFVAVQQFVIYHRQDQRIGIVLCMCLAHSKIICHFAIFLRVSRRPPATAVALLGEPHTKAAGMSR